MEELLYTIDGSRGVLFALKSEVELDQQTWDAITGANTWGELRSLLPDEVRTDLEERLEDNDLEFDDDEEFDREMLPGYGDGDYPVPLQQSTLDWFPRELVTKYGVIVESRLSGESVAFPVDVVDRLVGELEHMGYRVEATERELW